LQGAVAEVREFVLDSPRPPRFFSGLHLSELIETLTALRESSGDCWVTATLGGSSSEFLLGEVTFVARGGREVPPHQEWLPPRVVISLTTPPRVRT
jgi:hypothetical protein